MAFEYSITKRYAFGDATVLIGTYTNGELDTGGDIKVSPEIRTVQFFTIQPLGTSSSTTHILNESFPADGDAITVVTAAGEAGLFMAIGV